MIFARKKQGQRKALAALPFHYDALDNIPKKVFIRIMETGNVSLLSNIETDEKKLIEIWEVLMQLHLDYNPTPESQRIFRLSKQVDMIEGKLNQIIFGLESLRFEFNQDEFDRINSMGYRIRLKLLEDGETYCNETYHSDIDKVERDISSLIIKAKTIKQLLPKNDEKAKHTIDDVMASYSAILGFGFNFNSITYTEFHGYARQVDLKIKALESQKPKK